MKVILLLLTFLYLSQCATVEGICYFACNPPVNTTGLALTLSDTSFVNTTVVGPEGNFTFYDVPVGTYILSAPAYQLFVQPTSLSIVVESGVPYVEVDFLIRTEMQVIPPPNWTVECGIDISTNSTDIPVVYSICEVQTITYTDSYLEQGCQTEIERTFLIYSEGDVNSPYTVVQTIQEIVTVAPFFTFFPSDVNLPCPADTSPAITGYPNATSNCDLYVGLTYTDVISGNSCNQQITRTWYATSCGISSSGIQLINVVDYNPPIFTYVPPTFRSTCAVNNTGSALAFDSCTDTSLPVTVTSSPPVGSSMNCQSFTNSFTATDPCGNRATVSQNVIFNDDIPPEFSTFPGDYIGTCSNYNTDPSVTGMPSVSDNCPTPPVVLSYDDYVYSSTCPYLVFRNWMVEDSCGNLSVQEQVLNYNDY